MSSTYIQSSTGGVDNYSCCRNRNIGDIGDIRSNDHDRNRDRNHREPGQGDVVLRANTGTFGPSSIPIVGTLLNPGINQPIASVTINTDNLEDPTILVQFNGILTTTATVAAGLTFNFTLFRNCRGSGFREQLRSFSVSQALAAIDLADSRGLSFAFSQSDENCEKCCTYTLELTSITATVAVGLDVTVTGTLSVLAVGE